MPAKDPPQLPKAPYPQAGMTEDQFIDSQFAEYTITLEGNDIISSDGGSPTIIQDVCLICGSVCYPGSRRRHYLALHAFKGF